MIGMTDRTGQQQQQHESSMNACGLDITPGLDGGVRKKVLREGSGTETPLTGDRVFVHYVGTLLDGTKFDSSRDRNKVFDFKLGRGAVIKAWDIGVGTMRQGEVAKLTCTPDYAYGDTGSGPIIGPFATLVFEIELFKWEGEDVSEQKDRGVVRRLLYKGEGYLTPNTGATVRAHITGKLDNKIFDDRDVQIVIGAAQKDDICSGLEQAFKKMKLKEHSMFVLKSKHAFGESGKAEWNIPGDTDITYEVVMNGFERKKEVWELDSSDKMKEAELSKENGRSFFKAGDMNKAAQHYKKIVSVLEHDESEAYKSQRDNLMLAAHLNLALCYLKLGSYHEAEKQCDQALGIDKKNVKGLYRRAQARGHKNQHESAIEDFREVLKVEPNNKAAMKELSLATQKLRQFRDEEKKLYAGMFSKFAAKEPVPSGHIYTSSGEDVFQTIDEWNNDMAKDMMSLEQELEAFGEKMPDKHEKGSSSRKTEVTKPND